MNADQNQELLWTLLRPPAPAGPGCAAGRSSVPYAGDSLSSSSSSDPRSSAFIRGYNPEANMNTSRRHFLSAAAAGGALAGLGDLSFLSRLPVVSADEAKLDPKAV